MAYNTPPHPPRLIAVVIMAGFLLTPLSTTLIAPTFPLLSIAFNTSSAAVKFLSTLFFIGYAVGQLIWGSLSDYYGRRLMLRIATALYVAFSILFSCGHSLLLLYACYVFIGLTTAAYTSVGNAVLKDTLAPEKITQAIATVGIVMACGPTVGAFLGTSLSHALTWRSVPAFQALLATILLLTFFTVLPETLSPKQQETSLPLKTVIQRILSNRAFLFPAGQLSVAFGCLTAYIACAPFVFHNVLHFSIYTSGWLIVLSTVSYILGAVTVLMCVKRLTLSQLIRAASGIMMISTSSLLVLSFLQSNNPRLFITAISVFLFALGMLVPLCKSACMQTAQQHSGTTASLMKSIQSVGAIAFTLVVTLIHFQHSLMPLNLLFFIAAIITTAPILKPIRSIKET